MSKINSLEKDPSGLLAETCRDSFATAAVGLAVLDLKGRWQKVNPCLCKMVGYTPREMMNLSFRELTHPDDLEEEQKLVRKLLAGEIPYYDIEKRYLHKEGRVIWILLTVTLVRDAEGAPRYFICRVEEQRAQSS